MCRQFTIILALILWALPVSAGVTEVEPTPGFKVTAPTNISKDLHLEWDISFIGMSDFNNGLGSVSVTRTTLSADYSIFKLSYGLSHFNWEQQNVVSFSSSGTRDPWENLHDLTLQARLLNNKLSDNWRYWVNGEISSSFERDFPGAVGVGFDGGVAYDFWNGWMLGVKAKTIAVSALSDDLFGELELGLALAVSQKTLRDTFKAIGLMSEKSDGSDQINFSLVLSGAEKTYRLSPDSPVRQNGYLGLVRSKIGGYLDYSPDEHWTFSLGPEFHYSRKYKLYDSKGKLHSSHRLDNAWAGHFRVHYRF